MAKKSTKKTTEFSKIYSKLHSFVPVNRNGWWIKFSTQGADSILIVFMSMFTGQTVVKHFTGEDDAVDYINFIMEKDAKVEYDNLA